MTEYGYYFDGVNHTEATESEYHKMLMPKDGYLAGDGSSELAVIQNTPPAMNVVVGTGVACVQGIRYVNDAAKTVTVDAADATNPRIDRIVIRLTWSANTMEAVYLKGTAAASPSAPALTQTSSVWEVGLCTILIPTGKSSILAGDITDTRDTSACGVGACRLGIAEIDSAGNLDMAGREIKMGTAKITGLGDPTLDQDAETKSHVAGLLAAFVPTGTLLGVTVITSGSGNFTTMAATRKLIIELLGGGGGSGSTPDTDPGLLSASGGCGAYLKAYVSVTGNTPYAYVVGVNGIGGFPVGSNGTDGTDTTFVVGATTYTAGHGSGSPYSTNALAGDRGHAANGTATNGNILNLTAGDGGGSAICSAYDGIPIYRRISPPGPFAGSQYGYGGAGSHGYGNNGGPGIIVIYEYA